MGELTYERLTLRPNGDRFKDTLTIELPYAFRGNHVFNRSQFLEVINTWNQQAGLSYGDETKNLYAYWLA